MKQFRKEHIDDIYLGDTVFFILGKENSFSKSIQELDAYPRSEKQIGETDPDVQAMGIQLENISNKS